MTDHVEKQINTKLPEHGRLLMAANIMFLSYKLQIM